MITVGGMVRTGTGTGTRVGARARVMIELRAGARWFEVRGVGGLKVDGISRSGVVDCWFY